MSVKYVGALDQGTTSTRFSLFDKDGRMVSSAQMEHDQVYPRPGWVEHDPVQIWENTLHVIAEAMNKVGASVTEVAALGVTNQRETTVLWDRNTGRPLYNAIVWQDTRTAEACTLLEKKGGIGRFRTRTGLPVATYFSGPKLAWILDNVPGAREAAVRGDALFGTIDSWLIWNLTGGVKGGVHMTDYSNASRTMLFNIKNLEWDDVLLKAMNIPRSVLPVVRSSSDPDSKAVCRITELGGVPVLADLGDQQAALFGQCCFGPGEAKNTYGTGCFLLMNTGSRMVRSNSGLITTIGYRVGHEPVTYALEGSIAIAGSLVQWARDRLGIIHKSPEIDDLARSVDDNGGVYFVPAFSGLFAPYWRKDARGIIAGLTHYAEKGHIARAILEATAYQSREIFDAMRNDSRIELKELKVDGGMAVSDILMQFQSDILNVPVIRPKTTETTSLGAAYAAGLAAGFWKDRDDLRRNWVLSHEWKPQMDDPTRRLYMKRWKMAVTRSMGWDS